MAKAKADAIVIEKDSKVDSDQYTIDFKLKVLSRLEEIYEWVKQGYTDYSIADKLGIHYNTFGRYKKEYSVFGELYARATKERNCLVMNSMFRKATGEKAVLMKEKVLNTGQVVQYKEEQYIPADVNAADLFLRNNDPEYKSAKMDTGSLTLIQNNFQIPQLESKLQEIVEQRKALESRLAVDVEVIE